MPILRIKLPNQGEVTHVLAGERVTIGRRPDNTIQIVDRSVSGHHAELVPVNGHYRLHDLESTNLSFVEGQPVTDFHLHGSCRLSFGTVECDFDATPPPEPAEPQLTPAQMEKDMAYLRAENTELIGKIHQLERRIDILSSARLVTGKSDTTSFSASGEVLRSITAERDELRHQNVGLKLELENVGQELTITVRERDAARQAAELLQMEKVTLGRELRSAQSVGPKEEPSWKEPAVPPKSASTQRMQLPIPAPFDALIEPLDRMHEATTELSADPASEYARTILGESARLFVERSQMLGDHAIARMSAALEALLHDVTNNPEPINPLIVRTLDQTVEFLGMLLDPRQIERGKTLAPASVLAVDDDTDLLATIVASLELSHVQTTGSGNGEEALGLLAERKFDLLLLDIGLPGLDGPNLCARARETAGYSRTPIVFLTGDDCVDKRAEASLSGGNDFLSKPINVFELTVKTQIWILKSQLGLL